jgi:ribosomal protein S6--L-glutamate ligase
MKIGILSRKASLYSTGRLKQAAHERGHEVRVVDYTRCYMNIASHKPRVLLGNATLNFDAVVPRIGASHTFYGTAVVRQFEMMGVFSVNDSQAISRSHDRLRALQLLARAGVGMPITGFARSVKDIDGLIHSVGDPPLVIRLVEGTQGVGVVLAETPKAAESVIAAFKQLDANILVQQYVREAEGDVRAFVVGGKVVAAMRSPLAPGELGSGPPRGEAIKLTRDERALAVRAAKVLGLDVAGVDILRSHHGPVVIDVNASPDLEGIEAATGVNVADHVIAFIEKSLSGERRAPQAE